MSRRKRHMSRTRKKQIKEGILYLLLAIGLTIMMFCVAISVFSPDEEKKTQCISDEISAEADETVISPYAEDRV